MQPTQLNIERQPASNGDTLVTRLIGKLSLETVHDFISTMRPEPATRLVLDMSRVSFLDSAGVGALVSLFVSRRNNSKSLALAALTQQGNAVMQVSGLLKLLPVYPSVEEAVSKRRPKRSLLQLANAVCPLSAGNPLRMIGEESVHESDLVANKQAKSQAQQARAENQSFVKPSEFIARE